MESGNDSDPYVEEMKHFKRVIDSFLFYKSSATKRCDRREKDYLNLEPRYKEHLPDFLRHLQHCRAAIDRNYDFLQEIVNFSGGMFQNIDCSTAVDGRFNCPNPLNSSDMDRVRTTLTQFVRDWSDEGKEERDSSYGIVLDELEKLYSQSYRHKTRVLVPGAGLGRLMHEIVRRGFICQGNEFSLYMLFASNFILNRAQMKSITIYPWVHQSCNVIKSSDPLRPIAIPDIDPTDLPHSPDMSMIAGDFLEVYNTAEDWNCVVTCFFLDTAHNVIAYIEKIHHILKRGGYWINFGPLLYHFADLPSESSLEIPYEEIKRIITKDFKFKMIKESLGHKTGYINNNRSMLKSIYESAFFIVRKENM